MLYTTPEDSGNIKSISFSCTHELDLQLQEYFLNEDAVNSLNYCIALLQDLKCASHTVLWSFVLHKLLLKLRALLPSEVAPLLAGNLGVFVKTYVESLNLVVLLYVMDYYKNVIVMTSNLAHSAGELKSFNQFLAATLERYQARGFTEFVPIYGIVQKNCYILGKYDDNNDLKEAWSLDFGVYARRGGFYDDIVEYYYFGALNNLFAGQYQKSYKSLVKVIRVLEATSQSEKERRDFSDSAYFRPRGKFDDDLDVTSARHGGLAGFLQKRGSKKFNESEPRVRRDFIFVFEKQLQYLYILNSYLVNDSWQALEQPLFDLVFDTDRSQSLNNFTKFLRLVTKKYGITDKSVHWRSKGIKTESDFFIHVVGAVVRKDLGWLEDILTNKDQLHNVRPGCINLVRNGIFPRFLVHYIHLNIASSYSQVSLGRLVEMLKGSESRGPCRSLVVLADGGCTDISQFVDTHVAEGNWELQGDIVNFHVESESQFDVTEIESQEVTIAHLNRELRSLAMK